MYIHIKTNLKLVILKPIKVNMTFDEKQRHMREMAKELTSRPLWLVIAETGLLVVIALTALIGMVSCYFWINDICIVHNI